MDGGTVKEMIGVQPYEHRVQYYETDQMGIVHHSNYIRWFEEARTDMLRQMGIGYGEMERRGIASPVLEMSVKYRAMTRFEDVVVIRVDVVDFNGITLRLAYQIEDKETGEVRCTGESRHCFLDKAGRPMSLKRSHWEIYEVLSKQVCTSTVQTVRK
ncbi:thioesterase family protein [Lachnospiraceae bacterium 46-15]